MVVEIHGTGAHNAGAELMAFAIREWSEDTGRRVVCAVNDGYGTYQQRGRSGFVTTFSPGTFSRSWIASFFFSDQFLRTYGMMPANRVHAVLDASGYAYGDKWETPATFTLLRNARRWSQAGRKVILLPQSFGPFENTAWKKVLQEAAIHIDMIFARDATSYDALRHLDIQTEIHQAPDFTVGVQGYIPVGTSVGGDTALVVPNQRVRDKGEVHGGATYLNFLVTAAEVLRQHDLKVVALSHSTGDDQIIADWQARLSFPVEVIREKHPLVIKGLLSMPGMVVGSRYHALVSAMLQQVPCIGVGWSHKYSHLFEDFGVSDMLLDTHANRETIEGAIHRAIAPDARAHLMERLREGAGRYSKETGAMWSKVEQCLALT